MSLRATYLINAGGTNVSSLAKEETKNVLKVSE